MMMGKTSMITVVGVVLVQFVMGYLWYTHLFGDVMTVGGHGVDFLKLDLVSVLLIVCGSYGLTYILTFVDKLTGTKDIGGGMKMGLIIGAFAIGLPIVMLLNVMGFGKVVLLVVFMHLVLTTILSNIVVIKLKH